jgi:uncharacterized protein YprB with RNaseH-like and TPR domain
VLRATFQLLAGLGPRRERALWAAGVVDWGLADPAATAAVLPQPLAVGLADRAAAAEAALAAGDLAALGRLLPDAEHWRLYPTFADRAVFLDIEADPMDGITAIGLLGRDGPRLLLGGRQGGRIHTFPDLVPESSLLVTFNGACFDLPHLRRAFPDWRPPPAHIDLRPVWQRLGQHGGLKALEQAQGFGRPAHLRGLDGDAACWLWRHGQLGNHHALQRFAEYNLYDVINLPPLLGLAYNRLVEKAGLGADPVHVSYRGDVLYDVSKIVMAL